MPLNYLIFERSEGDDGIVSFDAMASTQAAQHAAVMAEAQQVLDWARARYPHTEGPVEEGMDWDHDLQVSEEAGAWHTVTLTLTCSLRFAEGFEAAFVRD
jgi:hypothetical protein